MIPKTSEQTTKTMSIIKLALLNGASVSILSIPRTRSAKKTTNTINEIVIATMQSPFCTGGFPQVAKRLLDKTKNGNSLFEPVPVGSRNT